MDMCRGLSFHNFRYSVDLVFDGQMDRYFGNSIGNKTSALRRNTLATTCETFYASTHVAVVSGCTSCSDMVHERYIWHRNWLRTQARPIVQ
jgi:hypothetical protein